MSRRREELFQGYTFKEPRPGLVDIRRAEGAAARAFGRWASSWRVLDPYEDDFLQIYPVFVYGDEFRREHAAHGEATRGPR